MSYLVYTYILNHLCGNIVDSYHIYKSLFNTYRIRLLTGEMFGRGNGFSVAIDDSWDEGLDVNF